MLSSQAFILDVSGDLLLKSGENSDIVDGCTALSDQRCFCRSTDIAHSWWKGYCWCGPRRILWSIDKSIVRAFVALRRTIAEHNELAWKITQLERKLANHDDQIIAIIQDNCSCCLWRKGCGRYTYCFCKKGELRMPKTKPLISTRLDSDILEWFKSQGAGYQTRMNAVLRMYMEAHNEVGEVGSDINRGFWSCWNLL
jgi:hypothetical protein